MNLYCLILAKQKYKIEFVFSLNFYFKITPSKNATNFIIPKNSCNPIPITNSDGKLPLILVFYLKNRLFTHLLIC